MTRGWLQGASFSLDLWPKMRQAVVTSDFGAARTSRMTMPTPSYNPMVQAALPDVLDTQLPDQDPPETRATLERLLGEGVDEDEARRLIGCVIAAEIFAVMKSKKPFDRERFVGRLATLPEMPWLED